MALRMRKSVKIAKGVNLNFGKTGASLSFGPRGLRQTIHSNGRRTTSIGIPGSGISYVKTKSMASDRHKHIGVQQNAHEVREYENMVRALKTIHTSCDEEIDWKEVNLREEPFKMTEIGPREKRAREILDGHRPNLFLKVFKSLEKSKRESLKKAVEKASLEDKVEYYSWRSLNELSERILQGDIDAYFQVIYEMKPLDDLLEFGSDFEFGADNSRAMEVEFKVKSKSIIPTYSLSLTKTGRLSRKELSKTAYYGIVQDYVCSCAIRVARDMFALLPINVVFVHAVDNCLNTQTGHNEDVTILSVVVEREALKRLNFERIDPSDAMSNFKHNMEFLKTSGFRPVERISNY